MTAPRAIIAIDPGASGGLAVSDRDGAVSVEPMPDGMTAQVDYLRRVAAAMPGAVAVVERVGYHHPGNSAVATAKFARHCGHIEAALYALGVPVIAVAPATWMRALGSLPADKRARKAAIKEAMARRYPHIHVTLAVADALGLLTYFTKHNAASRKPKGDSYGNPARQLR